MSTEQGKTVYIETFGCQMNASDTEVVLARLADDGYSQVDSVDAASLVLYNTCSVRDGAEAKVRGRLDSLKPIKRERKDLRIGVMGCMAQRAKEELIQAHPHVDLVVGTDQFVHMPALLKRLEQEQQVVATDFGFFESENWSARRREGVNAWIPVMRGCNYNCTYCIVPKTRGREKSRDPNLIESEVRDAVANGHVQVTLLGQTVDAYGKTLGDGTSLAKLLYRLNEIDGLERLRFVTSHPKDITDELLIAIRDCDRVAKHLHVPAQCGSSRVLRLMGRRYTREGYLDFVERARRLCPGVEILTDIIVGFPTETDEDFAETMSLMRDVQFDGSYVFMYSPRPGTGAWNLPDDVPEDIKRVRCNEALGLQLSQQEERYGRLHGQVLSVLIEGVSKSNDQRLQGRSQGNLNVVMDRAGHDDCIGRCVPVRINGSTNLTLYGEHADQEPTLVGTGGLDFLRLDI
ncbi:MAG: tRNA (N6-isopentenyl adenosine(37)-C2)-methylthiotransferase MiaB [Planctomycetota bacterium]|jgi:tRNA-2-methylthio-N6-dimethylallyladenosine synthase|nr:tRNA (N6-isopentenyl adenosine(37)-C2)-methylthiotransferase MiaB [Planctomycetota bacterium]